MRLIRLEEADIEELVGILKNGGVIVFPTETVYGLLADAENPEAVRRVVEVKGRSEKKPISILVSDIEMAKRYVRVDKKLEKLWTRFSPGPITYVLDAAEGYSMPFIVSPEGKVGVRCPDFKKLLKLISALGRAVTGTSANLSGEPPAKSLNELSDELISKVDAVVFADEKLSGVVSTVVELSEDVKILRNGPISLEEILDAIREK